MVKIIVKLSVLAIFLLVAWLFRKSIIAMYKKIVRIVTDADKKLTERIGK